MELRPYQKEAVEAVYNHLRTKDNNPCVCLPTGAGKSLVLAQIAKDAVELWNGRVLILAHVKELLEQNADKIRKLCPTLDVGMYSAGLNRRDTDNKVIVAGIQSVCNRATELGHFDLVIVDECHLIPESGEGRYRTFLADAKKINPILRVIGLTATPYRTGTGPICKPENLLNEICYEANIRFLIEDGYLSPIRGKSSRNSVNTDSLHIRAGEFIESEMDALMNTSEVVRLACAEILHNTEDRKSVIIFCCSVAHARAVVNELHNVTSSVRLVTGETAPEDRAQTVEDFKNGIFKFLVNVNIYTTGFDAPNVDCVVFLRATASPNLYAQGSGRGLRLSPQTGKTDCLVLDFGKNILRHGPIDDINSTTASRKGPPPLKVCPECDETLPISTKVCTACGFVFEPKESKKEKPPHQCVASDADIISKKTTRNVLHVNGVTYHVHEKYNAPPGAPKTVCVTYQVGFLTYREWLCPEHTGYARRKFEKWWRTHAPMADMPTTAQDCVSFAMDNYVLQPKTITVKTTEGEQFPEIVGYELPEIDPITPSPAEVPF